MHKKHKIINYLIWIGIFVLIFSLGKFFPGIMKFFSPSYSREMLLDMGIWGYFVYVFVLLVAIPSPTPSTPLVFVGGYVYGLIPGTILALIATIIGSTISFVLVRKFGKPLLEQMVSKKQLLHFNHVFKKRGKYAALISYALPIFPADIVSWIFALTRIKYHEFIILVIIGHIPRYLIINSIGEDMLLGFGMRTVFMFMAGIIFVLIAAFRKRIKLYIFKELREIEKEVL